MNFGDFDLAALLPFIAVGFAAQLVDGALGMAFGVISNTLLVGVLGVPPALASQRVHIVECFTTGVSGISHLLHRNIDGKLFVRLVIPGMIGGVHRRLLAVEPRRRRREAVRADLPDRRSASTCWCAG